jgi:hypothetical protein
VICIKEAVAGEAEAAVKMAANITLFLVAAVPGRRRGWAVLMEAPRRMGVTGVTRCLEPTEIIAPT